MILVFRYDICPHYPKIIAIGLLLSIWKFLFSHFSKWRVSIIHVVWNLYQTTKILDRSKLKEFADDKKSDLNSEICFGKDRKCCGKRRKCWLPVFSPLPTILSKGFFFMIVKSPDCVDKSSAAQCSSLPASYHEIMKILEYVSCLCSIT